jgi:hypothetical protein
VQIDTKTENALREFVDKNAGKRESVLETDPVETDLAETDVTTPKSA